MKFYLGTKNPAWFKKTSVPLFLARRRLADRKRFPRASGSWALDSGAFTEVSTYGGWTVSAKQYSAEIDLFACEVGKLEWAAPQDWMCEPWILEKTGLTVAEHQWLTIQSVVELRESTATHIIPVLQGWEKSDYLTHVEMYGRAGIDLTREPVVGLGSVCRRQKTNKVADIVGSLHAGGLRLHGFGVKMAGLSRYHDKLVSADSMAWSYAARRGKPLPECTHIRCEDCLRYALRWYQENLDKIEQAKVEALTTHRTCQKCGVEKPLDAFAKDPECKFGRRHCCQQCKNGQDKRYRPL